MRTIGGVVGVGGKVGVGEGSGVDVGGAGVAVFMGVSVLWLNGRFADVEHARETALTIRKIHTTSLFMCANITQASVCVNADLMRLNSQGVSISLNNNTVT